MTAAREIPSVTLTGADYSVYTRIARIALDLKGVRFRFEPLDVFAEGGTGKARLAGHPFGKIPVLRHGDLTLFETLAITRYIDQAFDGPPLEPAEPAGRARMNQIISVVDTAVYPVLVWGLHVPRSEGREPEPETIAEGRKVLSVLEDLAGAPWICGSTPSLADAYLAATMDYVLDSAAGDRLSRDAPRLWDWWQRAEALMHES
ncbi:glutathione S-transferase family protein [Hoeflea ulvae]|uniref:Glutathione S-transferase family protein n=1 Tax=Hoeflea ulvae TaxID=2983764 RepID=A0ABT3YHY7_9HYPH|nr:glutathione S-transferase family protein [Hoeflea ulvae]MCY0095414.1 glutathione S-transferase family protein [Hoeflea ulvae]